MLFQTLDISQCLIHVVFPSICGVLEVFSFTSYCHVLSTNVVMVVNMEWSFHVSAHENEGCSDHKHAQSHEYGVSRFFNYANDHFFSKNLRMKMGRSMGRSVDAHDHVFLKDFEDKHENEHEEVSTCS